MSRVRTFAIALGLILTLSTVSMAQMSPEFELSEVFIVSEALESFPVTNQANLALNTEAEEMLVIFYDTISIVGDGLDPITGDPNVWQMVGVFINPTNFEIIGEPFIIMGNPDGEFETMEVDYNPVTDQYIAIGKANSRGSNGAGVPIISVINPSSNTETRLASTFVVEEDSEQSYDDVSVAINTNNGGYLVVAEKDLDIDGDGGSKESIVGILFDSENNQLNEPVDLDAFNVSNDGDVDDPDVQYLPENDLYFAVFNTDGSQLNAFAGRVIQPTLDDQDNLVLGEQTALQVATNDFPNPSHPSVTENPFTGEFIGAYDIGNSTAGGFLAYFEIGPAPDFVLTETRETLPYVESPAVEGDSATLVDQRHPQMAVDPTTGTLIVAYNVAGGYLQSGLGLGGMLFNLLGPDGNVLPANEDNPNLVPELTPAVYTATPNESGTVSNSANNHNVKYDPNSGSFIILYTTSDGFTNLVRVDVTSDFTTSVNTWSLY